MSSPPLPLPRRDPPPLGRRWRRALAAVSVAAHLAGGAVAHEDVAHLILDADLAVDDARALALLLVAPDVRIDALLTSDGASPPCLGAQRAVGLIDQLAAARPPIGVGRSLGDPAPPWAGVARALDAFQVHPPPACADFEDAIVVARRALERAPAPVTWVALGPLTNLADLLAAAPALRPRIGQVVSAGELDPATSVGWNASRDRAAAASVRESGIPLKVVDAGAAGLRFDAELLDALRKIDGPAARLIVRLHDEQAVKRHVGARPAPAHDDATALTALALGRAEPLAPAQWRARYLAAAGAGGLAARTGVVLERFPEAPAAFRADAAPLVVAIRQRHGAEEWAAALLAHELHRHLGVYSVVGVKMGIRARERLAAALDELEVESRAGLTPPLSCLTDGLQAATGATLGRGAIRVAADAAEPAAVFVRGAQRLRLTLKPEVRARLERDVADAVRRFGPLGPQYFAEIRRLALRCWLELDRRDIFREEFEAAR